MIIFVKRATFSIRKEMLMNETINIYCDESCYLQHDDCPSMVLGAIICPKNKVKEFSEKIRELKKQHKIPAKSEIKWTKISKSKTNFYIDLINLFHTTPFIKFRAVKAINKKLLHHKDFKSTHDNWYYVMYYRLLINIIIYEKNDYFAYIDIKDTKSSQKRAKLQECISNTHLKNQNTTEKISDRMKNIQAIRSEESQLLQLADILIGATGYEERVSKIKLDKPSFEPSTTKLAICKHIKKVFKLNSFEENSKQSKFNLFIWSPDYKKNQNA